MWRHGHYGCVQPVLLTTTLTHSFSCSVTKYKWDNLLKCLHKNTYNRDTDFSRLKLNVCNNSICLSNETCLWANKYTHTQTGFFIFYLTLKMNGRCIYSIFSCIWGCGGCCWECESAIYANQQHTFPTSSSLLIIPSELSLRLRPLADYSELIVPHCSRW